MMIRVAKTIYFSKKIIFDRDKVQFVRSISIRTSKELYEPVKNMLIIAFIIPN
jgi:hypothetical protein